MRVGIIGDKNRASAWEKHLRPLSEVQEVVISQKLSDIHDADACILLDDSAGNLQLLSDVIKLGIHSYLVANLPSDSGHLKKICQLIEESGVRVQFSHWPSFSPATQWMKQQLPKPDFIQIIKEHSHLSFTEYSDRLSSCWTDEITWIVKWMDLRTHLADVQQLAGEDTGTGIRIYLKFENGASASFFYFAAGSENIHRRIASGPGLILDYNVDRQAVRKTQPGEQKRLIVESRTFDATKAAELSATLFIKAIKEKSDTAFTAYNALKAARAIDTIRDHMKWSL